MLILTRRKGQAICIGDDIRIVITRIDEGQVRIGIETSNNVPIYREELLQEIRKNNRDAAASESPQLEQWLAGHFPNPNEEEE
ncbi:carbon storage regulator [Candidatus Igneacidithiobacillus taiwanensis]|uniref:carbon storage regulator n=1 Tax=Candidatus Igneacidithiobacillus taiwanensis TaxID=1945924 RepID=UPI002899E007|nr:carbon storage regulator [Candidatus Igneacidithiobacillus taiwanensis]MCE5359557.1 carbon storage regulator [Acidithiobacillus sp.]